MTHDEWTRLALYFAGECTPEEAAEVRRWLEADSELRQEAEQLRAAWDAAATPSTTWDTRASWPRLAARIRARERRSPVALVRPAAPRLWTRRARWQPAAIAAAALLAVGGVLWRAMPPRAVSSGAAGSLHEVRTAPTQRTTFQLTDGSRIVLAPGSLLRYDAAGFGRPNREVYLEGRAYFEVAHDSRRPFVVRTARAVTEDLGTEFVITDYPTDTTLEVAVASGKVAVRRATAGRTQPSTVLARNELARLDGVGRVTVQRGIDMVSRTAWADGRLVFLDTPVTDVVNDLNRWYGIDIRLSDASLARQRFTASYTTQPDSVVIRGLATAIDARVERRGALILLTSLKDHP